MEKSESFMWPEAMCGESRLGPEASEIPFFEKAGRSLHMGELIEVRSVPAVDLAQVCLAIRRYRTVGREYKALAIVCVVLACGCAFVHTEGGRQQLFLQGWGAPVPYFSYGVVLFFFSFVGFYCRRDCEKNWRFLSFYHDIPKLLEHLKLYDPQITVAKVANMKWHGLAQVVEKILVKLARGKVIVERSGGLRKEERMKVLGQLFSDEHDYYYAHHLAERDHGVYYRLAKVELGVIGEELRAERLARTQGK